MSDLTKNLIKKFEGLRLTRYQDVAGVQTIGWGHTGKDLPERITLEQAEEYLKEDIQTAEWQLANSLNPHTWDFLPRSRQAVLISFVFNLGIGNFNRSGLKQRILADAMDEVPHELSKWRMAGGKAWKGLVRRRAFEALLWCGDAETIKALETALEGGV